MKMIDTKNMNEYVSLALELNYLEVNGKVLKDRWLLKDMDILNMTSKEFLEIANQFNKALKIGFMNNNFITLNNLKEKYRYMCIRVLDKN